MQLVVAIVNDAGKRVSTPLYGKTVGEMKVGVCASTPNIVQYAGLAGR